MATISSPSQVCLNYMSAEIRWPFNLLGRFIFEEGRKGAGIKFVLLKCNQNVGWCGHSLPLQSFILCINFNFFFFFFSDGMPFNARLNYKSNILARKKKNLMVTFVLDYFGKYLMHSFLMVLIIQKYMLTSITALLRTELWLHKKIWLKNKSYQI